MTRQPRLLNEYLHVIVRGIGKQILFENDSDRERYLHLLKKYSADSCITVIAYCIMDNHVHLLLRDPDGRTPIFMKRLGVSYAQFFNGKYERTGHLFQDRYKSEIITCEAYLLSAFRYILNNPVKAGICPAEMYRWSSFHEFGRNDGLTDTDMICEMIGGAGLFNHFMERDDVFQLMEADDSKRNDSRALLIMQKTLQIKSGTQLQQYDRDARNKALHLLKKNGLSVRQIERLTGISRGIIQRA